ncbi:MAG: hypothetical protein IJO79_07045 [Firmicutes bacterium]|nr:hypothetical protein [Bacillota bacterium]
MLQPRPILALNFDYNFPYHISLEGNEAFSIRVHFPDRLGRPLTVTRSGSSANIQIAPYLPHAEHDPSVPNRADARDLVLGTLHGTLPACAIPDFLSTCEMMYAPDNAGVHCLCANKEGEVCLVTPGLGYMTREDFPDGFVLFTNFHLLKHKPINREMKWITCERYRTAYEMLLADRDGVDRLFDILEAVKVTGKKLPTIFSMVAQLDTGEIDFAIDGDFSRRYHFSFADNRVRSGRGCASFHAVTLTEPGLELSVLRSW